MPPDRFVSEVSAAQIVDQYGPVGDRWLQQLPDLVSDLTVRWDLESIVPDLSDRDGFAAAATRHGQDCDLRIHPDHRFIQAQVAALGHWSRSGLAPRVLGASFTVAAYLTERPVGDLVDVTRPQQRRDVTRAVASRLRDGFTPKPGGWPAGYETGFLDRLLRHAETQNAAMTSPWWTRPETAAVTVTATDLWHRERHGLLHAALEPRHVHLDVDGQVTVVDPTPTLGPLTFDLAWWCLRAADGVQFDELAGVAAAAAGVPFRTVRTWGTILGYVYGSDLVAAGIPVPAAINGLSRRLRADVAERLGTGTSDIHGVG